MNLLTHTPPRFIPSSILIFALTLSGCGGGGDSKSTNPPPTSTASSVISAVVASSSSSTVVSSSTSSTPVSSSSSSSLNSLSSSSNSVISSSSSSAINNTDSAVSVIRDQGGLFFYASNAGEITSSALIGNAEEAFWRYENDSTVSKPHSVVNDWLVLGSNGWTQASHSKKVTSYNNDGSVTTQNNMPSDIEEALSVRQVVDLAGLNILDFLEANTNTNGMVGTVKPSAIFASGAKGYKLNSKSDIPVYSLYFNTGDADGKCWGGDSLASASGGNCVSLTVTENNNIVKPAASGYANVFSAAVTPNQTGYRGVNIGNNGPNKVEAQIINDDQKTVKFYINSPSPTIYTRLIGTATWSESTLPYLSTDNKVVHFTIPQSVYDEDVNVWLNNRDVYIAQQNGYLRNLYVSSAATKTNEDVSFNATANANILAAQANHISPLVGNWKIDDTDTFIFSDNNTFTHVKTVNDDDNCQSGSATGTYSWNPLTFALNVELQTDSTAVEADDSCSIGGKFKLTPNGNTIVFFDREDNKDYTFTKVTSSTGLAGTWVGLEEDGYTVILFTDTQYFISDYHADGGYGTENGTYIYNAGTGKITPTVLKDNNDDRGFSDSNNQQVPLVIAGDNNSFTAGDGFVAKRLK